MASKISWSNEQLISSTLTISKNGKEKQNLKTLKKLPTGLLSSGIKSVSNHQLYFIKFNLNIRDNQLLIIIQSTIYNNLNQARNKRDDGSSWLVSLGFETY
jgi:hypothetical protein